MSDHTTNQFILFVHGKDFDVDAFLGTTDLSFEKVWRRGDVKGACFDVCQYHETSGVETVLGDGRIIPLPEQMRIACAFLVRHRESLRRLASFPGADHRILGLQRHIELHPGIGGFAFATPSSLMAAALDVHFVPTYYVTIDHDPCRRRQPPAPARE